MSDRVKWIEHKGKKILFSNYNGLKGDEYTQAIKEGEKETLNSGMKTVYVLNDVTDSFMNDDSTAAAKQWVDVCKNQGITLVISLVGISGLKRIVAQAVKRDMHFAKSLDDAKDWLASK